MQNKHVKINKNAQPFSIFYSRISLMQNFAEKTNISLCRKQVQIITPNDVRQSSSD